MPWRTNFHSQTQRALFNRHFGHKRYWPMLDNGCEQREVLIEDDLLHFAHFVQNGEDSYVEKLLIVRPELANSQRCANIIDCALPPIHRGWWLK